MSIPGTRLQIGRIVVLLALGSAAWPIARSQAAAPAIVEDTTPLGVPLLALDTGGHTNAVNNLTVTPYGDQLISVGADKTIRFWDVATGEPLRVLRPPIGIGNFGVLYGVAVSPDGKRLAVGGYRARTPLYDHRIHIISMDDGRMLHSLKGHAFAILDLEFSPDGTQLASSSMDSSVRIWDAESGTPLKVLKGHTHIVNEVTWSPDGKHLLSGSTDKTARIWSAASGATEAVLSNHAAEVSAVAWSPDGLTVATGGKDRAIHLYEPSGKRRYSWSGLHNELDAIAFSPDSKQLMYTFGSDSIPTVGAAVLDMVTGRERVRYTGHENGVTCGLFVQGGKLVATGDSISCIRLWDPATGKTVRRLDSQGKALFAAGWSPDGQAVAWGSRTDNYVERIGPPLERTFCFNRLDFGPPPNSSFLRARPRLGGMQIGSLIEGGKVNARTIGIEANGNIISKFTLPDPFDHVRSYSLLSGNRAAVGGDSGAFVIDSNTGRLLAPLNDRGGEVWNMAPSPDFRYLAAATNDQVCRVWDVNAGKPLVSLFVAGQEWIAWTPEGYYAASLAGESLMGWHVNRGAEQMSDYYPASQFHDSLYRPDVIRRLLVTGSLTRSLEIADRERETTSRPIDISYVLPPQITITAPVETQVESQQSELTVRASATAVNQRAVKSMRLIVDGRPYGAPQPVAAPTADDASVEKEWTVKLPPGKHKLLVKAQTDDSYGLSRPIQVTQAPAVNAAIDANGPATGSPAASPPAGNLYVLAVGADPADARDAQEISASLGKAGTTQFNKVITRGLTGPAATPAAIDHEIEQLRRAMTLGDTAVIYYGGHDAIDSTGQYVLQTSSGAAAGQADVSTSKLQSQLAAIQGRLVLMLNLTHADEHSRREAVTGFCGSSETQDGTKLETAATEWVRKLLSEDYGVAVIGGTRAGTASGAPAAGLSPLTQAFTEAIGGRADANHDGAVDFKELAPYMSERVRLLSGGKQAPTIQRPRGMRSFPLVAPAANAKP